MTVAAIIPTIGRAELTRAVKSVLDQTVNVLPIVVLDRPELANEVRRRLEALPHELIVTSGAVGGAAARNIGVRGAQRDEIAFLDDDDEWLPRKIESQMALLEASPNATITSRAVLEGRGHRVVPELPYTSDQDMASYLLDRSTFKLQKHFIQSSTLLLSRDTALRTPWRDQLPRHQDWTLLIDLRRRGVEIITHPDALVKVHQGSVASISRSTNWRASEAWLADIASAASPTAQADFLCSVAVRAAISAGDLSEAGRIIRRALPLRPHFAALIVGISELGRRRTRQASTRPSTRANRSR